MKAKRILAVAGLTALVLAIGWWVQRANAEDDENTRPTLRGLKGVHAYVYIDGPTEVLEGLGLTERVLTTDVELRLRQASIPILTEEQVSRTPGLPQLRLVLLARSVSESTHILWSAELDFAQEVSLARDPTLRSVATTWSSGALGYHPTRAFVSAVRETAKTTADAFANAYLSQNPKK